MVRIFTSPSTKAIMPENQKPRRFLKLPRYPGGSEAFKKFIYENLKYPQEALEKQIEGRVIVGYEIDDNGIVHKPHIIKGLGYGCDEEAMRVIGLLRFGKVKNRGRRVKVGTKTNINFRLPKTKVTYTVTPQEKPSAEKKEPVKYGYTVKF